MSKYFSFRPRTKYLYGIPVLLFGVYVFKKFRQWMKLPPGPIGLPFLGHYLSVDKKNVHLSFQKIADKYGEVCSVPLGTNIIIIVSDFEMMKAMLNLPVFLGRPRNPLMMYLTKNCGIAFAEGESWSTQRKLCLHILRNFGFAKTTSVDLVMEEVTRIEEAFLKFAAEKSQVQVASLFTGATNSVIAALAFGRRYQDDSEFEQMTEIFKDFISTGFILEPQFMFPQIGHLAGVLTKIPHIKAFVKKMEILHDYILRQINKRKELMVNDDSEPLCVCDSYILEQRKAESQGDYESFKDMQLIRVCLELFFAGTDTTARSLEWLMLYMARYPRIQDRVHEEIIRVLGPERRPQMSDKLTLPYTEAVIDETFRKVSLLSLGVFHRAMENTYFNGYYFPSNASLFFFTYRVHHNPTYFPNPNEYNPDRFIDTKGQHVANPHLMPFLIGRRSCLGESLARMEIFIIYTAIMQRFKVHFHPDHTNNIDDIFLGKFGAVRTPGTYKLQITQR